MEKCGTLIPSRDQYLSHPDDIGCLKKGVHYDEHVNITKKNEILLWGFERCPNCDGCPIEDNDCFIYETISKERALKILKENYEGNIPEEVLKILEKIETD